MESYLDDAVGAAVVLADDADRTVKTVDTAAAKKGVAVCLLRC